MGVIYIYLFMVGACVASFMNVIIDRLPSNKSFVTGRSHCDACGSLIKPYDLIPVLSYIFLKGRCRECHQKIGISTLVIECLGGCSFLLSFMCFKLSWMTLISFIVSMILLVISMIDWKIMEIPNGLVLSLLVIAIIRYFLAPIPLIDSIMGMFCISVPMFGLIMLIPDGFGGGDVKLMFAAGALLGWVNIILAGFIGIVIAGVYASYLLINRKNGRKDHIAFGPYLCMGIYVAMMFGDQIIKFYLSLF